MYHPMLYFQARPWYRRDHPRNVGWNLFQNHPNDVHECTLMSPNFIRSINCHGRTQYMLHIYSKHLWWCVRSPALLVCLDGDESSSLFLQTQDKVSSKGVTGVVPSIMSLMPKSVYGSFLRIIRKFWISEYFWVNLMYLFLSLMSVYIIASWFLVVGALIVVLVLFL